MKFFFNSLKEIIVLENLTAYFCQKKWELYGKLAKTAVFGQTVAKT